MQSFIKTFRKPQWIIFAVILTGSVIFAAKSRMESTEILNKYNSLVCIANEVDRSSIITFIASCNYAAQNENAEIFDVKKGMVIRTLPQSNEIQTEALYSIKSINGMYVKAKALPENGYIIRVPLSPPVDSKTHWLKEYDINTVKEVFFIFPENQAPYLMILDKLGRPLFYNFTHNTDKLLKFLNQL